MRKGSASLNTDVIAATRAWVWNVVVGLNLCPFARREVEGERVRYVVADATAPEDLVSALHAELMLLLDQPDIETTLLIHPGVLRDFDEYNAFLDICDELLVSLDLEGIFQIASFHPDYQFADATPEDPENFSNRSPFPMLHLLREVSVTRAVSAHPDVEGIPSANIARLRQLGVPALEALLAQCRRGAISHADG
jgi:hypothetical protein